MSQATDLADYLDEVREDGMTVVPMMPADLVLAARALRSYEADQRDAARLDDMERTKCYPFWNGSGWTYIVAPERSSKIERKGTGATVREAIDAAMRQSDKHSE